MAEEPTKQIVCFDFDGVIHSYKSGWQGMDIASDPPVPGIAEVISELRDIGYKVVVYSGRCRDPKGIETIARYLRGNGIIVDEIVTTKPMAVVAIDDRVICFDGDARGLTEKIINFTPWYGDNKTIH